MLGADPFGHPILGGLTGDGELAALLAPEAMLGHLCAFEAALARAMAAEGLIAPEAVGAIEAALADWRPDLAALRAGAGRDGMVVPAFVAQVRATIPAAHAAAFHAGATSQDVLDTAQGLALRAVNAVLVARIAALEEALEGLAARFGARPFMARTRMQDALEIRLADRIAIWAAPLPGLRARLAPLRPLIEAVQLGGPVGDLRGFGGRGKSVAAHMAAELGLAAPDHPWHTDRGALAAYASWLAQTAGAMGKIGQDMALMAQAGEVRLAGAGGSSAMAHKQNPVLAELLVTLARFAAVQAGGLHQALVHEQERSGAAWTLEWLLLPGLVLAAGRSLGAASQMLGAVEELGLP